MGFITLVSYTCSLFRRNLKFAWVGNGVVYRELWRYKRDWVCYFSSKFLDLSLFWRLVIKERIFYSTQSKQSLKQEKLSSKTTGSKRGSRQGVEKVPPIQVTSRSYFRVSKFLMQSIWLNDLIVDQNVPLPGIVKGADKFLKSRSKQARPNVRLAEVRSIGFNGAGMGQQSKS